MKVAIIIPDGCADEPQESLQGKTPMQAADTPAMDAVAQAGVVGLSCNTPQHLPAGSDVANMSLLGYDPNVYFTGRAPLEAAAQGIELGPDDWAIRCNLVTIQNQIMRDFTADHIDNEAARQLLNEAQQGVGDLPLEYVAGVSYRNLLLWRGSQRPAPFSRDTRTVPPHDLTDRTVAEDFPRGPGSDLLNQLMEDTVRRFAEHPVNQQRAAAGKLPATNVWLWGMGRAPQLTPFADLHHRSGAMITAVDLLRGLANLIGWQNIEVPGATGYTDTDYAAKGRSAVEALPDTDIICVHVEATDEASHEGDVAAKIQALEQIDQHIVAPLYDALQAHGEHRILISPDHPTPVRTKTHSHGHVPFALAGHGVTADQEAHYDEASCERGGLRFDEGHRLMSYVLGGERPE